MFILAAQLKRSIVWNTGERTENFFFRLKAVIFFYSKFDSTKLIYDFSWIR